MSAFTAIVDWPSAPLTKSLVLKALSSLESPPTITSQLPETSNPSEENILQWSTYDAIDHELTYSHPSSSKVLSSSYVIRKALIRKHYLSRCVHNYLIKHSESALHSYIPRTWDIELSYADELDELFGDELYELSEELDRHDAGKWWILKPGMSDRGMGIRLFHSREDLVRIFEEFDEGDSDEKNETKDGDHDTVDTGVVTSQLRHFVIQEYLMRPVLFDPSEALARTTGANYSHPAGSFQGHKFHLRTYCVASGALSLYLYDRILALFSSASYSPPSKTDHEDTVITDLSAHLTNTSLQTDKGEAFVRLFDELVGCHILSDSISDRAAGTIGRENARRAPRRMMGQAMDVDKLREDRAAKEIERNPQELIFTASDLEDIKSQICEALAETFKAALDMSVHFQPLPNAFELYGIDFLVTHIANPADSRKFQVHLLEVNAEPAIEMTGPRLHWILEDLFKSIGQNIVSPFFSEGKNESGSTWEVGQTRDHLRKCFEVEVRGAGGWAK